MRWVDWVIQTTAGHFVGIGLSLGVGLTVAYFRGQAASWVGPLLYGLGAAGLVLVVIAALAAISSFSHLSRRVQPQVTTENVEDKIRDWLYTFGASVDKLAASEAPGAIFAMRVKPAGAVFAIIVQRKQELPHYLFVAASIQLGPVEKELREKLNQQQITELTLELQQEMSRAKIGYNPLSPSGSLLDGLVLERRIPITDDLTEDAFMQRFTEVQHDLSIANSTLILGLGSKVSEGQ